MPFAEVAVNSPIPAQQTFTYRVPDGMSLAPGQTVYVPFGQRLLQGVVMELTESPAYPEARDIAAVARDVPPLLPHQLALARWLSFYYLAPLFDCVALMLPPGLRQRPLTYLRAAAGAQLLDTLSLTEGQRRVLSYVVARGQVSPSALERAFPSLPLTSIVASLVRRGLLQREYALGSPRARPRLAPYLRLLLSPGEAEALAASLAERQGRLAGLLRALAREGPALPLARLRQLGLSRRHLERLLERGWAALEQVPQMRDPLAGLVPAPRPAPVLTRAQEAAAAAVVEALAPGAGPAFFLLYGVTGSGKTEVYLRVLQEALARGRRAIVLVPEIALTPQTVHRFAERFPGQVTVLHSGLSPGEHYDTWHRVREGRYGVVIGARSAIFAPQPDLGLVIIDEEHEWTYKQDEAAPRYHARRVAEELCRLTGAVLLLGSATPSVESYHLARAGLYRLLELPERLRPGDGGVAPSPLPEVEVVDMRQELRQGNRGIFSRRLLEEMATALANGEQMVLFLNRRGTASLLQCRVCGHVPSCPGCGLAYTYHGQEGQLQCHHCNRRRRVPASCPSCSASELRPLGVGTQRVEEEVRRLFPGVRTLRWDRDVARSQRDHQRVMETFASHRADVLIGTQMLAKGLHMPLVTLTGVVLADIGLHLPDFRSSERTFQLLEQVAGRAGRGPRGGRVIVQTYSPGHPAIVAAARHDYRSFYESEVALRQRLRYPPFGRLARLTYVHPREERARLEALRLAAALRRERDARGLTALEVLGPAPAHPHRLRGRYRWHVTLKGHQPDELLRGLSLPQGWTVDIDPVHLAR